MPAFDLAETQVFCADAALYAKPGDTADLAEKILLLAGSPRLREELGKKGRLRVEKVLSWRHQKESLLTAYDYAARRL